MARFLVTRLLATVPVLLGAATLAFVVMRIVPGDPVLLVLNGAPTTPEVVARMRHEFHFDHSQGMQYLLYLRDLVHGNLGVSMSTGRPVTTEIGQRLSATLDLTGVAAGFALLVGLALGVIGSLVRRQTIGHAVTAGQLLAVSAPPFWLGLLLLTFFSFRLGWFNVISDTGAKALVLPSLALGLPSASVVSQLIRQGMSEVLAEPYITTARAKGLGETKVRLHHALRNTLIPVVSISGVLIGGLLMGAVAIEIVFARQGVGKLAVDSIISKDLPVVQGIVLLAAVAYTGLNIVVDLLYRAVDPRIR